MMMMPSSMNNPIAEGGDLKENDSRDSMRLIKSEKTCFAKVGRVFDSSIHWMIINPFMRYHKDILKKRW